LSWESLVGKVGLGNLFGKVQLGRLSWEMFREAVENPRQCQWSEGAAVVSIAHDLKKS
jgi:hypothetical protein